MGRKHKTKNSPAQPDSGISKLGVLGILRSLGILGGRTKNENGSPQRDSGNSKLDFPLCLCDSVVKRLLPAQRHSKMSNLPEVRSQKSGVRMKTENRKTRMRSAQQHSIMSNFQKSEVSTHCMQSASFKRSRKFYDNFIFCEIDTSDKLFNNESFH